MKMWVAFWNDFCLLGVLRIIFIVIQWEEKRKREKKQNKKEEERRTENRIKWIRKKNKVD